MQIRLHKNARTTPAVRQEIRDSELSERVLAKKHGISRTTARKWKRRHSVEDASHRPHTLHTTLTPAQEAIVVYLRQSLLLPLDDLLAVTREFLSPAVSRSGLDRCRRRHGVASLKTLVPPAEKTKIKPFKAYEPEFLRVDVKYLPAIDGEPRRYLFVAIDRATRWVSVSLKSNRTALSAKAFLKAAIQAAPFRIQKCLTDNGSEFTDRFPTGTRQPSGTHDFDRLCAEQAIEHRLIPPRRPQTNGMVERFNGRIEEVLQTHRFDSTADLESTLHRYKAHYPHVRYQACADVIFAAGWNERAFVDVVSRCRVVSFVNGVGENVDSIRLTFREPRFCGSSVTRDGLNAWNSLRPDSWRPSPIWSASILSTGKATGFPLPAESLVKV
jgi:transposase InsO family protein